MTKDTLPYIPIIIKTMSDDEFISYIVSLILYRDKHFPKCCYTPFSVLLTLFNHAHKNKVDIDELIKEYIVVLESIDFDTIEGS
jgi:hypothetical protein